MYEIFEVDNIQRSVFDFFKSMEIVGQIHLSTKVLNKKISKILLKKDMPKKKLKETLYHEIAHGICHELSKEYNEFNKWNDNEEFIDYFASKLMTCFNIKKVKLKKDKK